MSDQTLTEISPDTPLQSTWTIWLNYDNEEEKPEGVDPWLFNLHKGFNLTEAAHLRSTIDMIDIAFIKEDFQFAVFKDGTEPKTEREDHYAVYAMKYALLPEEETENSKAFFTRQNPESYSILKVEELNELLKEFIVNLLLNPDLEYRNKIDGILFKSKWGFLNVDIWTHEELDELNEDGDLSKLKEDLKLGADKKVLKKVKK